MLKPLVPKFCLDLSVRLKGIAEEQVPAKLKPIVGGGLVHLPSIMQLVNVQSILPRRRVISTLVSGRGLLPRSPPPSVMLSSVMMRL